MRRLVAPQRKPDSGGSPGTAAVPVDLVAALQQFLGTLQGTHVPSGVLPFQFPSILHFDRRFAAVAKRAVEVDGLSPKSVCAYRASYRYFRSYLVETRCERAFLGGDLRLQQRVLEGWIAWLRTRGANHTTVNTYWRALHAPFARIAREDGTLDPTRFVATPKPGKSMATFLPKDALEQVFRFVRNYQWPTGDFERARNIALLAVMALGGCRRGEVLAMEVDDVNLAERTIRIKRGKGTHGGKPRIVCMPPPLVAAMTRYLSARARRDVATPHLFISRVADEPIGEKTIRRLCGVIEHKTGIHVAPHMLRHTCATLMRQGGIADRLSMEQLGHTKLEVLQRYSHISPGERRAAIDDLQVDIGEEDVSDQMVADLLAEHLRDGDGAGITSSLLSERSPDRTTHV
jgi:integrase/recombinase XerC